MIFCILKFVKVPPKVWVAINIWSFQLDCSPAWKPDPSYPVWVECYVYYWIAQFHHNNNNKKQKKFQYSINCQLEIAISAQPVVGSFPIFKLKLIWPNQTLTIFQIMITSNWRWTWILKVKSSNGHRFYATVINCFILPQVLCHSD
jgi:hypothetical protein